MSDPGLKNRNPGKADSGLSESGMAKGGGAPSGHSSGQGKVMTRGSGPEADPGNRVLEPGAQRSQNLFASDLILQELFHRTLTQEGRRWMEPRWHILGEALAGRMDALSLTADRNPPMLRSRNLYGQSIDELDFHPAYDELKSIAVHSGMFQVKWKPEWRKRFHGELHRLGFSAGLLYAMGEGGLYCPLCMTDGVARILDRFATPQDRERLLPHIWTDDPEMLFTGAMFLTEKSGGSDVGANRVRAVATRPEGITASDDSAWYQLFGEKWFCSNAGAEIALALARVDEKIPGTRGLSIFLVEPQGPDGESNPRQVLRLKEKLGVRSMASAELYFNGTWAKRMGQEGEGFAIMTEMINLSRLYNAVTAVALTRRALTETWQFLRFRSSFGKPSLEHALVRERMERLSAGWLGELHLAWRAISALDAADAGNDREARLLRILTPMVKRSSAEFAVYSIRECMELMGGIGYIEEGILPKMLRDANVLPIWEGAGNIMLLDMLRAVGKAGSGAILFEELNRILEDHDAADSWKQRSQQLASDLDNLGKLERDQAEFQSRALLESLTDFTQAVLLIEVQGKHPSPWFTPALAWYYRRCFPSEAKANQGPLALDQLEQLMGFTL